MTAEEDQQQAYTQPYKFGGRIQRIICQIKHELSIAIHEISSSQKKNVRWRSLYKVYKSNQNIVEKQKS